MKSTIPRLTLVILALCSCLPVGAKYANPDLINIPLQRLITNLSERAKAEPANTDVLHQLARIHAMAYASKLGEADAVATWNERDKEKPPQPWFGHEPPHVPYSASLKPGDPQNTEASKAHLKLAIGYYQKALAAKPADATIIKLGLAWCQDQAGEKTSAITLYREVAAAAWEVDRESGGGLGEFLYVETAGYLTPLLDPAKDAAELATLKERTEKLLALPRAITPLVIPVGQTDDLQMLVNHEARVRFDLDGSGRQREWAWPTPDAAWLVYDPQQSGIITSGIQMFGSRSFLLFCSDGYQALALLDDNRDGMLNGAELTSLALWRDGNSDGISDPGEVQPVGFHGITSLSAMGRRHQSGIPYHPSGVTFKDGSTRPTYDLILESQSSANNP